MIFRASMVYAAAVLTMRGKGELLVVILGGVYCPADFHDWLGRGLIFDDEIAAQADAHPTEARSQAAGHPSPFLFLRSA